MASNCPKCGGRLRIYHVKAECPHCKANIPNYNWEARLEEDSAIAEAKFASLYRKLNLLKYSVFGTKLRIARLLMSFIPAIGFILPWAYVVSEKDTLNFDLLGIFTDGTSTIKFFGVLFGDIGGILSALEGPVLYIMLGFLLMLLSIVVIVVAFFMPLVRFTKPRTNAAWITDIFSIILAVGSVAMFIMAGAPASESSGFAIGTLEFAAGASVDATWGLFVYIALLVVAMVGNLLVSRADITSEEDLEIERLAKVRIKQEKEEAERIRKQEAWLEAEKKKEEEHAEKVRKAREALENNK
ncbi:MAG: hypothetical protein J6V06_01080 [Clostridia bacterium]|nr:hypothetical protein [Clostridia bacterium]MBO7318599.1 hypothetical protein [Clostridia bacterium]